MNRLHILTSFCLLCCLNCLAQSRIEELKQEYKQVWDRLTEMRKIHHDKYVLSKTCTEDFHFINRQKDIEKSELSQFAKEFGNESILKDLRDALGSPYNSVTITQVINKAKGAKDLTKSQKAEADALITQLSNYKENVKLLREIVDILSTSKNLETLKKNGQADLRWKQVDKVFKEKADDIQKIESIKYLEGLIKPFKNHTGNPFAQFDELKKTVEKMK